MSSNLLLVQTAIDIHCDIVNYTRTFGAITKAEGSHYVNESFKPVKVNNRKVIYSCWYNAFNGDMEIKLSDEEEPIALDSKFQFTVKFINDHKAYQTCNFKDDSYNSHHGFLVIIFSIKHYSLLLREQIKFQDKEKAKSSYDQEKPAKYIRMDDVYYLKLKDNSIVMVPKKTKELAGLFSDDPDRKKDFIKRVKIKTNKESDLIRFIKYLETL